MYRGLESIGILTGPNAGSSVFDLCIMIAFTATSVADVLADRSDWSPFFQGWKHRKNIQTQMSVRQRKREQIVCWNVIKGRRLHYRVRQHIPCLQATATTSIVLTMKLFIAIATLSLAAIVTANPTPVEKRQTLPTTLPSIICLPSGSLLSEVEPVIDLLPDVPEIITCTASASCTSLPDVSDVPLLNGLVGVSHIILLKLECATDCDQTDLSASRRLV